MIIWLDGEPHRCFFGFTEEYLGSVGEPPRLLQALSLPQNGGGMAI